MKTSKNCDFAGLGIKKPSSSDKCARLCLENVDCTHFTWNVGSCYLKSAANPKLSSTKGVSCGWIPDRIGRQFNWQEAGNDGKLTWAHGCDFPGHDIGRKNISRAECSGLCLASARCTHFTWGKDSSCYMKSILEADISPVSTGDWICGYKKRRNWQYEELLQWDTNCYFYANTREIIERKTAELEQCRRFCVDNPSCNHFSYNRDTKMCDIISSLGPRTATDFKGGECGYISNRVPIPK